MKPSDNYHRLAARDRIQPDATQSNALQAFDDLKTEIGRHHGLRRWLPFKTQTAPRGIYLWGGVGRGKTFLMDLFFKSLAIRSKRRVHFHRFMHDIHRRLDELKGHKDPLKKIGRQLAREAPVLCFDEFFVIDIADAMILSGILRNLFDNGVTLIATSNVEPARLYENGLQRQRFLPAISLLQDHCRVLRIDDGDDHRLRAMGDMDLYHCPADDEARRLLAEHFQRLAPESSPDGADLEINGRALRALALADDVAWFDFEELCGGARSASDYLELAREFHALLLGNVPRLDESRDDAARRLINLIDVLYDHGVKLAASAAAEPEALYSGQRLKLEFQRTASRLREMRSRAYLAAPHRP